MEYYKKFGINKVYLYDNNDINGEKFEDVISDYIKSNFVEIHNWRGKIKAQINMINECYQEHKLDYDWVMFPDLDEYIHLFNNYTNLGQFLDETKFNKCDIIYLNLVCHSDNEQLHYENKTLKQRFPNIVPNSTLAGKVLEIKFILRGNLDVYINSVHIGNKNITNNCNGFGNANKYQNIYSTEPDTTYYYFDHYYSKSTEEFIIKVFRGGYTEISKNLFKLSRIRKYFRENKLTLEKILMIENATGINLIEYKKKLNKII